MKISIIQPSRNNLKYLKWSYASIRKNQGNHTVQICVADDNSSDGTSEWCEQIASEDDHFDYIVNDSGERLGHTILYDKLVNEVAKHEVCMIFHADMYLLPNALDSIEKHLYGTNPDNVSELIPLKKTIVSLTRIEPPLHPDGVEKLIKDFGVEPEKFDEEGLLKYYEDDLQQYKGKTTEGIFAPWAFFKSDFQEVGGHDKLYRPTSKEDSDLFNRFKLNGVKFIQTWDGYVYHMTCRGSRFNPTITRVGHNSEEWTKQNIKSHYNFIRKWGMPVQHDQYMNPQITPKYDVAVVLINVGIHHQLEYIREFEVRSSVLYIDNPDVVERYRFKFGDTTDMDLTKRVQVITEDDPINDVVILVDMNRLTENEFRYFLQYPLILADSGEGGREMSLGSLYFKIKELNRIESENIFLDK